MDSVSPAVALIFGIVVGIVMWITGGLVINRTTGTTANKAPQRSTAIAGALSMVSGVASVVFGVLAITDVMAGSRAMVAIAISALAGSLLLVAFLIRATRQANRDS